MAESALKKNYQCPLAAGLKVFDGMVQRTIMSEHRLRKKEDWTLQSKNLVLHVDRIMTKYIIVI
jgi:hypothetical protein